MLSGYGGLSARRGNLDAGLRAARGNSGGLKTVFPLGPTRGGRGRPVGGLFRRLALVLGAPNGYPSGRVCLTTSPRKKVPGPGGTAMKDPLQPKRCARLLSALAAPERLRIIRYLREGPRNVSEIAEMLKTSVVNASHHLTVLRHAGLVRNEKQGRYMLYSLPPKVFQPDDQSGAT